MSICSYCGKKFKKEHNREEYCSEECAAKGYAEKARIRQSRFRKKYKSVMSEKQKYGLGSYGARLGPHMNSDMNQEKILIQKEMKILKLKKFS